MTTKFKVGDTVYDRFIFPGIAGTIIKFEQTSYPIIVELENGMCYSYSEKGEYNTDYGPSLSLTDYTLEGFTQDRPWEPKEGEYVAVKNEKDLVWVIGKFSKISELGFYEIYEGSNNFKQIKPLTNFIEENDRN